MTKRRSAVPDRIGIHAGNEQPAPRHANRPREDFVEPFVRDLRTIASPAKRGFTCLATCVICT